MQIVSLLFSLFLGLQGTLLRVDYDPPLKRSFSEQVKGLLTGNAPGMSSVFDFKYLIYWVEILVILSVVLFAVYVAHSLNLFKRSG